MSESVDTVAGPGAAALQAIPTSGTDPDRPAIICTNGETVTYAELAERAARLAGALRELGLAEGDVVAILSENSPAFLEIAWACRLAALYHVVLNTSLVADEVDYILNDSGAIALIASTKVASTRTLDPSGTPAIRHRILRGDPLPGWTPIEDVLADAPIFVADTELEGDLLQYSSGTTGRPKGIKRAMIAAPKTPAEDMKTFLLSLIGADGSSTYLSPAPLYHTAPFYWTMSMLRMGATVVLMEKFDPVGALAAIEKHRVTHGQFVPTMFTRMLKLPEQERLAHDVSSLQGVVHAAAPCPIDIKRQMIDWWGPIVNEYWSSSEGAGFTFINSADWLTHPGSVGRSVLGPLHICDPIGNELPIGEPGMIWAEGVEFSYVNDAGKNASTTSVQGWRSVGDIGRFDEDGFLYLTDRANFMIITGGVNIYPQESENRLIDHPRVYDAAVIGLPDDELGEIAVGIVQLVDPNDAGPEFAAELSAWCEASIARYKCPRRFEFTDVLPRTETGKLLKGQLRDQMIQHPQTNGDTP
ncbi:fatty-acyl-CoA synthase [Nocardioides ginsengisegetis]|uniref:Fatty-acyl-CoA synthase n=1 Tax=Nocardioides ginsengisegetis TaxID=661491 RepID=A0A7W3PAY5_9ACTN|nr:AMP-binding protein [Nocardioides ginsengisegetis]MBA8804959.1 fatty-acyl-CoA synthase [Nocardioides ginsengisegetis]